MENQEIYDKLLELKLEQLKNAPITEAYTASKGLISLINSYVDSCELEMHHFHAD